MQRSWKNTGFIQWEILPDVPSEKKMSYIMKTSGIVKKIDEYEHTIIMTDQTVIPIEQISDIKCEEWQI